MFTENSHLIKNDDSFTSGLDEFDTQILNLDTALLPECSSPVNNDDSCMPKESKEMSKFEEQKNTNMNLNCKNQNVTEKKAKTRDYFEYTLYNNVKFGNCKICGKNRDDKWVKSIKMTSGNTTGLLVHLKQLHPEALAKIALPKPENNEKQHSLDTFVIVSKIFFLFFIFNTSFILLFVKFHFLFQ